MFENTRHFSHSSSWHMNQDVTNDQVKPIKLWETIVGLVWIHPLQSIHIEKEWIYPNKALRDTEHAVINMGHWMEAAVKLPQGSKSKQN